MSCVRFVYARLHSAVKLQWLFIYLCQALPCFQLMKKLNNWNSKVVYLVVCSCLLVVCGFFAAGLWSFADGL